MFQLRISNSADMSLEVRLEPSGAQLGPFTKACGQAHEINITESHYCEGNRTLYTDASSGPTLELAVVRGARGQQVDTTPPRRRPRPSKSPRIEKEPATTGHVDAQ
eukprot:3445055-Pyramimonas_sp.AAC.1